MLVCWVFSAVLVSDVWFQSHMVALIQAYRNSFDKGQEGHKYYCDKGRCTLVFLKTNGIFLFIALAPLGRFSHRVAMSVCVFVFAIGCRGVQHFVDPS